MAIENGPVEIVSFPMKRMVDLEIVMLVSLPEGNPISGIPTIPISTFICHYYEP